MFVGLILGTVPVVVLTLALHRWGGIDPATTVTAAVAVAIFAVGVLFAPEAAGSADQPTTGTVLNVVGWALAVLGTVSFWTFPLATGAAAAERYSLSRWVILLAWPLAFPVGLVLSYAVVLPIGLVAGALTSSPLLSRGPFDAVIGDRWGETLYAVVYLSSVAVAPALVAICIRWARSQNWSVRVHRG